jgi:CRP-like cAMP-binding protein
MCANYESMANAVAMMRDPSPGRRVARALLILRYRQAEPEKVIEATQADIASIANISVRSVAAALARLERDGRVLRGYGAVTIVDPSRLSQSVGSDIE